LLNAFDAKPPRAGSDRTGLDLETRLSQCLHLHEMISDVDQAWGDRVETGQLPYNESQALDIQSLYIQWDKSARRVFASLKRAKAAGRRLAMAEKLRDTIGFCYQARMDFREVRRNFEKIESGQVVRITEEGNGIRHRRAG
jgi:hypothetical protein